MNLYISNLKVYEANKVIPKGLQIKLEPQTPGTKSKRFSKRWNDILFNCSFRLLQLLLSHSTHHQSQITNEFDQTFQNTSQENIENIQKRLKDIELIENRKHQEIQFKKFRRDGIQIDIHGDNFDQIVTHQKHENGDGREDLLVERKTKKMLWLTCLPHH